MNGEGDRPLGGNAEAEWARLAGTIRLSAGFWLGFVFSPSAEDAVALRLRAERRLIEDARGLSVITCERPQALLEALPALLLDDALAAAGCVWVDGVRADPPGVEDGPWTRGWIELFLRANERRDLLRRRLAGGLVFAATPAIKPRVREAAPDLWSVRTLVLELAPVRPAGPSVRAWTPPALLVGRDRSAPDPGFALAEAARRAAKGDDVSRGLALVQATAGLLAEGLAAEARSAAQRAAGLLRDASPIDASRALALLAEAELAVGDATQGDAHIQQAVTIRSERDRDLVPIEWHDLAATAALARHAPERARASYALALATARERAGSIGSAEGLRELAVLLEKRAAMERDLGELAAARVDLEEAIRLRRRHRELTDDRRATRELAGTLDGAADAYRRLGEGALFDAASTEAAALREGLEEPAKQPADEPARVHPSWTAELGPYRAFLSRVEKVASLRDPDAKITPRSASAPFAGVLEVAVPTRGGAVVQLSIVGAVEQPVTEALLDQYIANVEHTYRRESPSLGSTLVHGGPPAPVDLVRLAQRRGVTLQSFGEYQGLLDFDRYLEWQTRALEGDQVHPPWLYVEQPARWSLPDGREETTTEHALATLLELLESPHPRFALVLGDFGAGKTFLLHELARRMARDNHPQVPVLVEMSRLEKQRDLRALLAQHFAQAGMGRFDPAAFQYMLAEGKIALLFDGFDELALRLTYDRAVEHFDTVLMAAQGNAKVVVTSRTQHFLNDQQVRLSLAKRAENVPGFRLMRLETFGEKQIRRFLGNLIPNPTEAEERYKLLDEVKDLLGLSENPRMLGFIARIEPGELLEARARSGEITAAKLYELLIGRWLDFEHARANPPGAPRGISSMLAPSRTTS